MHTIRIKELRGRSWETVKESEYKYHETAKDIFFYEVQGFMKAAGIAITWSEGKKVWGVYRVN